MVFDGAPPIINNSRHTGTRFKHKSRPNGDNKANQSHVRAMEIKIDSSQVNHSSLEVNKMQKLGLKSRYPWDMGKGTRWKRHGSNWRQRESSQKLCNRIILPAMRSHSQ
ncbi:Hypothetical predicted protein, partial [Olea europaea subsp. europaea]